MEMMVVLLIVAVVAAASAPMVNKRMLNAAAERSPWVWTGLNNSIAYNLNANNAQTAMIGAAQVPRIGEGDLQTRLFIRSNDNSAIAFQNNDAGAVWQLFARDNSFKLSTGLGGPTAGSVEIGSGTISENNSVVIGSDAEAQAGAVALGHSAEAFNNSVAIGNGTTTSALSSVAIGPGSQGLGEFSVAVGSNAIAPAEYSIAIGDDLRQNGHDSIVIGRSIWNIGENSVVIGNQCTPFTDAAGQSRFSTALGFNAQVGYTSTAIGYEASANHLGIAIGGDAVADQSAIAMGIGANSNETGSIAIGTGATVDVEPGAAVSITTNDLSGLVEVADSNSYGTFEVKDIMQDSLPLIAAVTKPSLCIHNDDPSTCSICNKENVTESELQMHPCQCGAQAPFFDMDGDYRCDDCDPDIDGDGYSNADEISAGTDPRNPADPAAVECDLCTNSYWRPADKDRYITSFFINNETKSICKTCKDNADIDYKKECWGGNADYFVPYHAKHLRNDSDGDGRCDRCDTHPLDPYDGIRQEPSVYADDMIGQTTPSIAIGAYAQASNGGISIGSQITRNDRTNASGNDSIAIGAGAQASGQNSVAIGRMESVTNNNEISIGNAGGSGANSNRIILGGPNSTVHIPGNLVVDGDVVLARNEASETYVRVKTKDGVDKGITPIRSEKFTRNNVEMFELRGEKADIKESVAFSDEHPLGIKSDRRLKDVGEIFTGGLEEIKKLEVFNYTFKKDPDKTPRVGVMAQDLQKIFPKAVFEGKDGFLRIRMEDMFYALVNAVKQLDAKIEELKNNQIAQLLDKVANLEKQNKEQAEVNAKQAELIEKLAKQNDEIIAQNKEIAKQNKELIKQLKKLDK